MIAPIIGVTGRTVPVPPSTMPSAMVQISYINAILSAGGIPVLIPSDNHRVDLSALIDRLDGILFTGGGDIALEHFQGDPHPAVYGIDSARDYLELELTRAVVRSGKSFFGICRGLQVINVALGGNLYTHIPDQLSNAVLHDYPGEDSIKARTALIHSVEIKSESVIGGAIRETNIKVNSLHHQGIKELGVGLKGVGYAPDGLVEAVELQDHPFGIAVQWHPEWLTDQLPFQRLFRAFVEAAARSR